MTEISGSHSVRMRVKNITSQNNITFKTFSRLTGARGIKKHGMALLSGSKQVQEVLKEFPAQCAGIILSDYHEATVELKTKEIPVYRLSSGLFRQIDLFDTGQPVLVVRTGSFPNWPDDGHGMSGCTLCVPFQDPANVGAVIRSAAAFGVSRVVMLKQAAHPFHPKSVRVAGSALFRVPIFEGPSLNGIKVLNIPMVTLSPDGDDIGAYSFPHTFCMIPGLEGPGLPESLRKATTLGIHMEPGVESINAALATGIALYIWRSGLKKR